MLCIACVTPKASEYKGRTAFTSFSRRKMRSILNIRTRSTNRPKPLEVFVPKIRSPIGMAQRSKTPRRTMTKSIQFQKMSSSEMKKPLQPSSRIRTTISKTKKRRMPWFTHHHAGLGESVSKPRTAALRQMTPPERYWNQSFSVQLKLMCLIILVIRNRREKLKMPTYWACCGARTRGSTKIWRRPRATIPDSRKLQKRSCLSVMKMRPPWWKIRQRSSPAKKQKQTSSRSWQTSCALCTAT
mmetsp:Transcript_3474/g.8317  ORF Transcript_3474/g.8317 Transcript_3474/m.8317 type:complete len:242 (-) Transcript_3474:284-1009(-)